MLSSDRMGSKGHELNNFNNRKNFFPLRVAEHGNRLARELMESPSLCLSHLDVFLCLSLQVTLPGQGGWTG